MANMKVVIAGGGTGGHVYPALAIADAIVKTGVDKASVHFVGSKRGIEADVVPGAGYNISLFGGRGIKRSLSKDNVVAIGGLCSAVFHALALLRRLKPSVVVSVGGYASAPCAIAAVVMRVPLVLAESNAVPGAANKLVARFAKASAVAFPDTPLPRATVTGNPVRAEIVAIQRSPQAQKAAKAELGMPVDVPLVGIFGGSLGSATINKATSELVELWGDRTDVGIYHVVGKRDWRDERPAPKSLAVKSVEYENRMDLLYSAADVLVCRSGATTSAEIAIVGIAAVFVPLPNAPGDHQTANARAFEKVGAAKRVADGNCNGASLAALLEPIIATPTLATSMGQAAKQLGHPDAADQVADIAMTAAR